MKSVYKFLSVLLLLASPMIIHAQEKKTKKSKNLLDYSMLDAYRSSQDSFNGPNVLMRNLYVTGGFDLFGQAPRRNFRYDIGTGVYLNVGSSFSPLWGGRISFGYNNVDEKTMIHSLRTVSGTADVVFNMSSFLYGYKPSRPIESKVFAGLGWASTTYEDTKTNSPLLTGGLQFLVKLNKRTRLLLEPYIILGKNRVPSQADTNWHHYDINYGVRLGLQYYLNQWNTSDGSKESIFSSLLDDSFFDLGVSLNSIGTIYNVSPVDNRLLSKLTVGGEIAFGRWITPMVGLRVGLGMSHGNWGRYLVTPSQSAAQNDASSTSQTESIESDPADAIGLRQEMYLDASFELLFNPLAGWRDASNDIAHLTLHGGLTVGTVHKSNFTTTESAKLNTLGWKVGPEFSLDMTPSLALYISPNYYNTSYSVPYSDYPISQLYDGKREQIQFGIRIRTNSLDSNHGVIPRLANKEYIKRLAETNNLKAHTIRLGGGASILKSYVKSMADVNSYASLGYSVFGIYSLNSMSSFRASLSYNDLNITDLIPHKKFLNHIETVGELGVDYLFNLSDLYANRGKENVSLFKVEPFVGIMLAKGLGNTNVQNQSIDKDFAFGYHAGLQLSVPVWEKLNLFLQGEYKDYGKDFMHYLPADYHRALSVSAGAYWTF